MFCPRHIGVEMTLKTEGKKVTTCFTFCLALVSGGQGQNQIKLQTHPIFLPPLPAQQPQLKKPEGRQRRRERRTSSLIVVRNKIVTDSHVL